METFQNSITLTAYPSQLLSWKKLKKLRYLLTLSQVKHMYWTLVSFEPLPLMLKGLSFQVRHRKHKTYLKLYLKISPVRKTATIHSKSHAPVNMSSGWTPAQLWISFLPTQATSMRTVFLIQFICTATATQYLLWVLPIKMLQITLHRQLLTKWIWRTGPMDHFLVRIHRTAPYWKGHPCHLNQTAHFQFGRTRLSCQLEVGCGSVFLQTIPVGGLCIAILNLINSTVWRWFCSSFLIASRILLWNFRIAQASQH